MAYALLEPRHIMLRRDAMVDRPEAANGMIKALRQVYSFAVEYGYHDVNPIKEVSMLAGSVDGFKAWSEEDVKAFEDRHPIGTMARLTMALALYSGQRRGDLIRLGPRHIKSHHGREGLEFVQHKNRNRPGRKVSLWVPIIPELRTIIDASKTGSSTFILTEFGRPFTGDGFGNRFRKWCSDAGLVGLSVHGLRKTAAAVLAENGCTEQEIMAITGHRTSKEVSCPQRIPPLDYHFELTSNVGERSGKSKILISLVTMGEMKLRRPFCDQRRLHLMLRQRG